MGQLQPYIDPTGQLPPEEVNNKNIQALMQEWNRGQDVSPLQLSLFSDGTTNRYMQGYLTDGWGRNKNVGIKASKPGIEVTTASDSQLVYKDDFTTKIWYDQNGVARIREGLLPDGSYGTWQSIPGVDVNNATSRQLVFNSNQRTFIVALTDTATIPGISNVAPLTTGVQGTQIAHNLGYAPAFVAYTLMPTIQNSGQPPVAVWNQLLPSTGAEPITGLAYFVQAGTDETNIYFTNTWTNGPSSGTVRSFTITYYLYNVNAR